MSNYEITFYSRDDLTFGTDDDGNFAVTIKEGATPETIKIVDNDDGEGANTFSGSSEAGETGQTVYGETSFDGDAIQPLAGLPSHDNPDDQLVAIGVGDPVHTVGYGFTFEPALGAPMIFNYSALDSEPSYDSDTLFAEGEGGEPSRPSESNEEGPGASIVSGTSGSSQPSNASESSDLFERNGPSGPSNPPCFTRGTAIRTARGEVLVEDLIAGDLVWTEGHGHQPIRWVCHRKVPAKGDFAPIRICAGALGANRDILVSPAHRMLIKGPEIEMLFGLPKALVAAKDLVNDTTIRRETTLETVEYFHILFDKHEVLQAHGTLSESFFPDASVVDGFGAAQRKELFALFPELEAGSHKYAIAYPGLLAHETVLIVR